MGAYPSEFVRQWDSEDGTRITIRPIRPEDAAIEYNFVYRLSPRSKYFRFFCGLNELTPSMLRRFTHIDYQREMALVATLMKENQEIEIAVGRFVPYLDGKSCEFALVVGDEWQHHGIGYQIMQDLIKIARARQFKTMKGLILSANLEMLQLVRDLGFKITPVPEDAKVMEAVKEL